MQVHFPTYRTVIAALCICVLPLSMQAASTQDKGVRHSAFADSLYRRSPIEQSHIRIKMMSSPFPVELRQQGRQIYAGSRNNQILPVYTGTGAYYAAFRLSKGTNWINGLPRGTYYINGRKFKIS